MTEKTIGDISKEIQDERIRQTRDGDEFESGSKFSYVTHHRRLLMSICAMMEEDLLTGDLRAKMKKASAICQRIMLLLDNEELESRGCERCGGRGFRRQIVIQNGHGSLVPYPCPDCNKEETS